MSDGVIIMAHSKATLNQEINGSCSDKNMQFWKLYYRICEDSSWLVLLDLIYLQLIFVKFLPTNWT